MKAFQEDFFRRRISENALLASFQQNLLDMYNWWDPIAANLITISALDFITGLLMEEDPAYQVMQLSDAALAWPDFLRRQTGSAVAYACMLFPMDSCPDTSTYIQVVEDMAYIVNILNDLLSCVLPSCQAVSNCDKFYQVPQRSPYWRLQQLRPF